MLKYQRIKKPARRPSPHLGRKNRFFILWHDGHILAAVYRLPRCDDF
ncbi:hypothetical protein SAMN05192544_104716 [Paraburkholderia hospita]|nr:hypothetical protein PMI06_002835 [Burkholderia sp. BT03]SEI23341.1 hypothetical protein SAMN05192544_104716 [Paraburkholderia hospita]SKC65795.1 hypothetical protein SAMN06266956_1505 [Paraburkholderia hospita]